MKIVAGFLALSAFSLSVNMSPALAQNSEDVARIQQFLTDKGCEPNGVDGQWGGGSQRAADRYFDVTGVQLGPDSDLDAWSDPFLVPACGDDLSLAPLGQLTDYVTPQDTITLPDGTEQYNWIPAHLRDFDWPETDAHFVELDDLIARLDDDALAFLGCVHAPEEAAEITRSHREADTSYESVMLNDQSILTLSSRYLEVVMCNRDPDEFQAVADLFSHWAEQGAFTGYPLRELAVDYRDLITRDPSEEWTDAVFQITQVLPHKEQTLEFLLLWDLTRQAVPDLDADLVASVETWLEDLVETTAYLYAEGPIDCPSYTEMAPGTHIMQPYIRRDVYETCINHGASRAGVSAMWALVSGDRDYAQDALNDFFMYLHSLRADGSHILESPRPREALYKAHAYLAYILTIAEAFQSVGIDLYAEEVNGKSVFTAMEFLAKASFDEDMSAHYAGPDPQEPKEFKDGVQWVYLSKFPDSLASRLILRHIASVPDRERLADKLFRLNPPSTGKDGTVYWVQLLPFVALYAPTNPQDFAPPDIAAIARDVPNRCPEMGWSEADEQYAGEWELRWSILNAANGQNEPQGFDTVRLEGGTGMITKFGVRHPDQQFREEFEIAYGGGEFCIAGDMNLFELDRINPVRITGAFDEGLATGSWPDGDKYLVSLLHLDSAEAKESIASRCPDMGWTEADEQFAGRYRFDWTIRNNFDDRMISMGMDIVRLEDGEGTIEMYAVELPSQDLREAFDIEYGGGQICIAGDMNLLDPTPVLPIELSGDFASGEVRGKWPDGDDYIVTMLKM